MAGRKRKGDDAEKPKTVRVKKRKPREGVKRAMNLVLLDENATKLEGYAVLAGTTPAEVVQDWIDEKTKGMNLFCPGLKAVTKPVAGGEPEAA
jgi:hypothetical protein